MPFLFTFYYIPPAFVYARRDPATSENPLPSGYFPRKCSTYEHPDRARIEFRLAMGSSILAVAQDFKLNRLTLPRHWARHVQPAAKLDLLAGRAALANIALAGRGSEPGRHHRGDSVGPPAAVPQGSIPQ
jgi:hypothetical protein